jgi:single-strand DNA-binding protein
MSVNKVILIGRVGADPEVKTFDNGGQIANFSLATSETWKDKQTGEKKEQTEWHNIQVSGGLVGVVSQWVKKGDLLYLEGSIKYRSYEKDGQKKYVTNINVTEMKMMGAKIQGQQSQETAPTQQTQEPIEGDNLPF